jgi:hypothetical protein
MHEISVTFNEETNPIEFRTINNERYFMIDTIKAIIPPHQNSMNIIDNVSLTFFVDVAGGIVAGVVANFLYNLIKTHKIKEIRINGKKIEINTRDISIKIIEGELSINEYKGSK